MDDLSELPNRMHIAGSAAPAKRKLSPDGPGEMPDMALPLFLPGPICF
jgi:hypothetical protein